MDEAKKVSIQNIVDREIKKFADSYEARFTNEVNDPEGVINSKKNNCFVAELVQRIINNCYIKQRPLHLH